MGQEHAVEMIVGDEDRVQEELERCRMQAEIIAVQRYSDADKVKFGKLIKEFNTLYYRMNVQTWCNTRWRDIPICKAPTDLWIYQELICRIQPNLIIETGTLAGGSALFLRDMLQLSGAHGLVISVDINMTNVHDRAKVDGIRYIQESSTSVEALTQIKAHIATYDTPKVMVILDSDHSMSHVLAELKAYAPLVSIGSALIVEDTSNHPGPLDAVEEWFMDHEQYGYQYRKDYMCEKFMLTFNRDGYYERVK